MSWKEEPQKSRFGSPMLPAVKQIILFAVGWLGFQVFATSIQLVATSFIKLSGITILSQGFSMVINSICYIGLIIALALIANKDLLKLVPSFKQWQSYIAGLICFASIIVFSMTYGSIIEYLKEIEVIKIPTGDNANQTAIVSLEKLFPFTSLIVFGFIGPICEELTYRTGLFSLLRRKNKFLAYFVTIILFAFIHFNYSNDTATLLNELLQLPHYMFAAFAFSFTYDKFGFAGSVSAHITNNVFSLLFVSLIH